MISTAIVGSKAQKVLLPIQRNSIDVIGIHEEPLPHQIDKVFIQLKKYLEA